MPPSRSRRARYARRRRRRLDLRTQDLTTQQWVAIQEAWGGCAYCGAGDRALQRDCVLAVSRGGRYTLDNVVPACRSCNASKVNHEVTAWMRRRRFDEGTFLLRQVEINRALAVRFAAEVLPSKPGDQPVAGSHPGSGSPKAARR